MIDFPFDVFAVAACIKWQDIVVYLKNVDLKTGQRKHGIGKHTAGLELLKELISASLLKVSFKA